MASANELLSEIAIRVAQNEDDTYTIYCYDVVLNEDGSEASRSRMDLTGATIVQQVKDDRGVLTGSPTADYVFTSPTVLLTDIDADFSTADIGKTITISGSTSPANDGDFIITGVPSSTQVEYQNASGVGEPPSADSAYSISDIIIDKNSGNTAQIEIHADQVTEATKGTAIIKYVGSDTSLREVGARYWHDIWVHRASGVVRIVKKSRFYIDDGVYEPAVGVPPVTPGLPATQTEQERSFKWTAPSTGDTFTVTIPGNGMRDAVYTISQPGWANIPSGGAWTPTDFPESQRTATTFQLRGNAPILVGTILDFHLRDA